MVTGEYRLGLKLRLSEVSVVCVEFEEIHGGTRRYTVCIQGLYIRELKGIRVHGLGVLKSQW